MYFNRCVPLPFILALFISTIALAEERGKRDPWVFGVAGGALHQFETDLKEAEGAFSVSRGFAQLSVGYAWDRSNSISLSVGYGSSDYDFVDDATISGNVPWGRIEDYRLSVPIRFAPVEQASVIVIPSVRSYADADARRSDGQTEGLIAGMGWKFSDRLTLGPGFGWYSELGGGSSAFPIIVVDWKITDRLSLETGRGLAASQGPGLTLAYAFHQHWSLAAIARYERIRFAVDENTSVGSFGEDRSIPLLLSLNYSPWPRTSASLFLGAELDGRISLEDDNGRRLAESDYETAPLIGLSFRSSF